MFNSYQEMETLLQNTGNTNAGNGAVEEELPCTAYRNEKQQCQLEETLVIPCKIKHVLSI